MTSPDQQQTHNDAIDSLQSLSSLQPPAGMQQRLLSNLSERAQHHQMQPAQTRPHKYGWELWAGASLATIATAVVICFAMLHANRSIAPPIAANLPPQTLAPAFTNTQPSLQSPRKVVRPHRIKAAALIPHTPPPLPLTSQERLLIALANQPALAAGNVISQPAPDHGLGSNSLFELGHEQLKPIQPEPLESNPLPPLPSENHPSGENQ